MKKKKYATIKSTGKKVQPLQPLTISDLKGNRKEIIEHITEQAGKENVSAVMNKMVELLGEEKDEKELALEAIDQLGVSKFKNASNTLAEINYQMGRNQMMLK